MSTLTKDRGRITKVFKKGYFYPIAFLIPLLILALVYALREVFPFGSNSVLVLDLNAQYIYYYEAFRDAILGDGSLLYSFSRTLGGEMVGTFAYYLASPFSLVLLLFPKTLITEAVLVIILLKVGTASVTFAYFLRKTQNSKVLPTIIFSIMYSLMSYMVVQTMNPMWLDGLILLPLIILGVKKLVDEGKYILFTVTLAMLFMAHYYIGYMTGIFVFVYFICYMFGRKEFVFKRDILRTSLRFIGATGVSVLLSLWLLIPTYFSLKMGKFSFTTPNFIPLQKLDLMDFLSKLLPMSYDSVNYQGYPFVFAGTILLLLVSLYFLNKEIDKRRKIASSVFIGVMLLAFTVSTLDIVLHGFQSPNWLNYRYSFILSFFLLEISYISFVKIKGIKSGDIIKVMIVFILLFTLVGRQNYEYIIAEKSIWLGIGALIIYTVILSLLRKGALKKFLMVSLVILISAEMFLNASAMISGAHEEVYYSDRPSYRKYFDELYPAVDYIKNTDNGFYRSETVERRTVNDPMALGIYGLSHSNSALNADVINMLHQLGYASQEHWSRYKGSTLVTDSVFGIKYIVSKSEANDSYKALTTENDWTVYKNPYAMPVAFTANEAIRGLELDSVDPFINQNALLSTLLGEEYTEYFKGTKIREVIFENMVGDQQDGFVSYHAITMGINAHIEYILETAGGNEMYMYLYSEYPRKVNIWLNKEYVDTFYDYESTCIMPLGTGADAETVSLITTPIEGEYFLNNNMFYYIDTPLFKDAVSRLNIGNVNIEKKSDTELRISATAEKEDVLFTTIPYDEGWRIKVNGQKVEAVKALDSLLCIPLKEGVNEITMFFIPRGGLAGVGISLLTLILFIGFILLKRRKGQVLTEGQVSDE